jgi:hypothetical protein
MINKQGQKVGPKRGSRQRLPYEPHIMGGRLLMRAELQTPIATGLKRRSL